MSDNYEFAKSTIPQGVSTETPYVSKQWSNINDMNSGVYSNNGLTQVQFDLSSIYNSSVMIDPSQMFVTIPITLVSAYTSNNSTGALVVPGAATSPWAATGLKCGYHHLIHSADLIVNGKTLEQNQPYLNAYVHFKLLSEMSADDLATLGTSLGMGSKLDNTQSMKFNPTTTAAGGNAQTATTILAYPGIAQASFALTGGLIGGNGLVNNAPFSFGTANGEEQAAQGVQFTGAYNDGYYSRLKKYADISNGSFQSLFGATSTTGANATTILSESQVQNEFKPYFRIQGAYMIHYDVAIIRMCDIFDSMKNLCLMKKFDGILRLYVNSGTVASTIQTGGYMVTSGTSSTFTNTCPIIQSSLATIPATAVGIASGLFIGRATATNMLGGVNLANSNASNPMYSCRMYYPQVTLKPEKLIPYISENRAKKIVYTSILSSTCNAITSGSTFSSLIQSGVTNVRGVLLIPFISSNTNGSVNSAAVTGVTTFSQYQSPFDTAPCTTAPISLTNLQVSIGGVNQLANTLSYNFENFLEQTSMYEKINQGDLDLSCGLINENLWTNAYRTYYVDCSRANIADLMTPRNVNVTFTNNSNVTIDVLIYTEFFTEMTVDVETGLVQK
jgi:hypothetical protein